MPHILVSGSLAYDRIMDFNGLFKDHFLPEKMHSLSISFTVEEFIENFGGTAGNIAFNLACFGVQSKIISTAGSDFNKYHAHLRARGIDLSATHIDNHQLTSSAFIITDKDDNQIAAFSVGAGAEAYLPMPDT
ncbi:carbohydrate kinase family protein, partial [Candidatus Parcubacteria bacterium]